MKSAQAAGIAGGDSDQKMMPPGRLSMSDGKKRTIPLVQLHPAALDIIKAIARRINQTK
jgi:hypothetical protein